MGRAFHAIWERTCAHQGTHRGSFPPSVHGLQRKLRPATGEKDKEKKAGNRPMDDSPDEKDPFQPGLRPDDRFACVEDLRRNERFSYFGKYDGLYDSCGRLEPVFGLVAIW